MSTGLSASVASTTLLVVHLVVKRSLDNIRNCAYSCLVISPVANRAEPHGVCSVQDSLRRFKAGIFQALAHPTRIAIVELLRDEGEVAVSRIYEQLGLEQANASQHLAVLRSRQIVTGRKKGNQVFYALRHPILGKVLNLMRQYFQANLNEALEMLKDMKTEDHPRR